MRHRAYTEPLSKRLCQVGKRRTCAQVDPLPHVLPGDQQRYVLSRVICARRRRIVAVIGRNHKQVVGTQRGQQAEGELEVTQMVGR